MGVASRAESSRGEQRSALHINDSSRLTSLFVAPQNALESSACVSLRTAFCVATSNAPSRSTSDACSFATCSWYARVSCAAAAACRSRCALSTSRARCASSWPRASGTASDALGDAATGPDGGGAGGGA